MTNEQDPIGDALQHLVPPTVGANDWGDVLLRARSSRAVRVGWRRTPRRAGLVLLAACLAAVLALAATGALHGVWRHRGPQLDLSAPLLDRSGLRVGTVRAELPGVFLTEDRPGHLLPHRMIHGHGLRPADTYPLRWRVDLAGAPVERGRIIYGPGVAHAGATVVALCAPCDDAGEVALTRAESALLVNGQLAFAFAVDGNEASGPVPRSVQHGLFPRAAPAPGD
jgi:hypothetical protein